MDACCRVTAVVLREVKINFAVYIFFYWRGENFSVRIVIQTGTANPFSACNTKCNIGSIACDADFLYVIQVICPFGLFFIQFFEFCNRVIQIKVTGFKKKFRIFIKRHFSFLSKSVGRNICNNPACAAICRTFH